MALTTSRGSSRRGGRRGRAFYGGVGWNGYPHEPSTPQPSSGGHGTLGPPRGEMIPNASVSPFPVLKRRAPPPLRGRK